jgi:hypothetical protein
MLGAILLVEAVALIALMRDVVDDSAHIFVVLAVALTAVDVPYGYVVGLVGGTALFYYLRWREKRSADAFLRLRL